MSDLLKSLGKRSTFFCFSPPIMLATFVIEIVLAIYTFLRHRADKFISASVAFLCLLATFQLAEYQVCSGVHASTWAQVGFVAITILPVLGLYLTSLIVKSKMSRYFVALGLIVCSGFIIFFFVSPGSITGALCGGNYIIFSAVPRFYLVYSLYYFFFIGIAIYENFAAAAKLRNNSHKREVLIWLVTAYASFLLPMGAVYLVYPETRAGIPSIMCGFAVLFALILVFRVIPNYLATRDPK